MSATFIRLLYHWSLPFGAYLVLFFFFCYLSFMQIFVWLSSESPWKTNSIIQRHRGRQNWTLGFLFPRHCSKTHSFFKLLFHSWKGTELNVHICTHTKSFPGDLQSQCPIKKKIIPMSHWELSPPNLTTQHCCLEVGCRQSTSWDYTGLLLGHLGEEHI